MTLKSTRHLSEAMARAPKKAKCRLMAFALLPFGGIVSAADLTIHLPANASISRKTVHYQCEANGTKLGVPSGPFSVEYINGGGNSLVIVPVSGNALIFANVMSGSGARYTAQHYTWWEAGGGVTLSSDSLAGKMQTTCKTMSGN